MEQQLTPIDLAQTPFLARDEEAIRYDPVSQASLDPMRALFTHCHTTATYDSSGRAVDNDGLQSDD